MDNTFTVSFPGLGLHDIVINRVAFTLFGINVYWYGILIAGAVILCILLATREAKQFGLNPDFVMDNFLVLIPSMIIGARLYYVIFSWDMYKNDLLSIFDTRKGGLAFYGGVIGGLLGFLIMHLVKKKKFEPFLDFIVVYVPLGQAIGRLGNFMNQEAFGTNTTLPWGMISNGTKDYLSAHPELGQNPSLPVHPTFLYEFIGNLILFFILRRFRRQNKIPYGTVAAYFIGYGLIRFFVEGIRTDSLYIGSTGIRASQLLSALMVVAGIVYLIVLRNKRRRLAEAADDLIFEEAKTKAPGEPVLPETAEPAETTEPTEPAKATETAPKAEAAAPPDKAEEAGTEPPSGEDGQQAN